MLLCMSVQHIGPFNVSYLHVFAVWLKCKNAQKLKKQSAEKAYMDPAKVTSRVSWIIHT